MEGEQQQSQAFNSTQQPILIKCSLRNHTPDEIYDYLSRNVGDLGMKIKKRQAIIGFEDQILYEKVLRQHKSIMLRGKRLTFVPFPKIEENYIASQQQQIVQISKSSGHSNYPEFKATNRIQAKINSCRISMLDKIQQLFTPTIQKIRERVSQLHLEFQQEGPRQREMLSLSGAVEKKLKGIQSKYEQDIGKINKFVSQFSMKPTAIDLQPTFKFDQSWSFPKITGKNMSFEAANFFKNISNGYGCKRLCAINGKQFAVSTLNYDKKKGFLKIYDVMESNAKQEMSIDEGAYAICRINNFLLMGGINSSIKYLNLEDADRCVENSRSLSEKFNVTFSDIKHYKKSVDKPEIMTLSNDNCIRRFQISFEEITSGLYTVSFEQRQCLNIDSHCMTFEITSPQVIVYDSEKKMKKYHLQKNLTKQIPFNDRIVKIKKFNENLCAVATLKNVQIVDLRTQMIVQTFPHMTQQIKALQIIGEHSMMFGAKGVIGLLDDRRQKVFPWKSEVHHKSTVYDILKLEERVISCDSEGKVYSWKLKDEVENGCEVGQNSFKFGFKRR